MDISQIKQMLMSKALTYSTPFYDGDNNHKLSIFEDEIEYEMSNGISFVIDKTGYTRFFYDGEIVALEEVPELKIDPYHFQSMITYLAAMVANEKPEPKIVEKIVEKPVEVEIVKEKIRYVNNKKSFMTGWVIGKESNA